MGCWIGIDPGVSGAIAAIDDGGRVLRCTKMPITEQEILIELVACASFPGARAMLERVHAFPKMGVVGAFTFGYGFGGLNMALVAQGIPFDQVLPRKWQGALSCLSGGDKHIPLRRAQQLFPTFKVTLVNSDALLLAEHCRRVHGGQSSGTATAVSGSTESVRTKTAEPRRLR